MRAGNTLVPLKATGVSFLVSDDRIPWCYTTSFSSTATMAMVRVASRRLSRIEVCSLYIETGAYALLTRALSYTPMHDTRKIRKKVDGSQFTATSHAHERRRGVRRDPLDCFRPEDQARVKNLTEKLVANLRNANYLINSLEVCRRGWRTTQSRFNEKVRKFIRDPNAACMSKVDIAYSCLFN